MTTPEQREKTANAEKAEAEARTASAEAKKAERETEASLDPELSRRQKEAEANKAIAEADKAAAEARRDQITGQLPDLSTVERGETTATTDHPMFGAAVAHRALSDAAVSVADAVGLGPGMRVLLTSDPDLATSDGVYLAVKTGLGQLIDTASQTLSITGKKDAKRALFGPIIAAAAAILPSVLSLFAAHRSVSSHLITPDDAAALASVAGALPEDVYVQIDDFRLVPIGEISEATKELGELRSKLVERKLTLDQSRVESSNQRLAKEDRLRALNAIRDELRKAGGDVSKVDKDIEAESRGRAEASATEQAVTVRIGVVESIITAIDTFTAALMATPPGGRSPLVEAALREQLHVTTEQRFSHVLLVKATSGSATQLVDDRPLFFEDKFTVVGNVNVSYVLIESSTSMVEKAGAVAGTAAITGEIGGQFTFSKPKT